MLAAFNFKKWFRRSLNCEQANAFILEYVEGTIPSKTRTAFESHMDMCPTCGPYFEQYQETVALVRETGEDLPKPPEELIEFTLSFLRKHIEEQ